MHHLLHRLKDEHRIVDVDLDADVFRQRGAYARHLFLDGRSDLEHVGRGQRHDGHHDGRVAIAARTAAGVFGRQLHVGHLTQSHHVAIGAATYDQVAEIIGCAHGGLRAQRELAILRFDAACGQFHVLGTQRRFDVADSHLTRRHGGTVQPDAHGIAALTVHEHRGHARHRLKAILEVAFGVVRQLKHIALAAGEDDVEHRVGAVTDFVDLRRIGFRGQTGLHTRNLVTHVVGGRIDVALGAELDVERGILIATARGQLVYALDAGDLVFDHLGDARLDHRRVGTAIGHADVDHR